MKIDFEIVGQRIDGITLHHMYARGKVNDNIDLVQCLRPAGVGINVADGDGFDPLRQLARRPQSATNLPTLATNFIAQPQADKAVGSGD